MSRMRLLMFMALVFLWLALSGMYDMFHICLGFGCAGFVSFWSGELWMQTTPRRVLRGSFRLLCYTPWLLWQILLSNLHVMKLVFHPRLRSILNPTMACFSASELDNNWSRYMLANSITLTPGTVTIMVSNDGRFLCHAISEEAASGLPQPMLARVVRAFNYSPDK
jgi:multicomponent Na+:H+ antiporter subunit E